MGQHILKILASVLAQFSFTFFIFRIREVFFVQALLLANIVLNAQHYQFQHYSVEDGLSHSTVLCTGEDSSGFIWLGTKAGLNRFDGYQFKTFKLNVHHADNALLEEVVYSLFTDKEKRLWAGTKYGLFVYNNFQESFNQVLDSLHNINQVTVDHNGMVWLITNWTLYRYDPTKNLVKAFPVSENFHATSICEMEDGNIWVSSREGYLFRFDPNKGNFTGFNICGQSKTSRVSRNIEKICAADSVNIYIATSEQGIKHFNVITMNCNDLPLQGAFNKPLYIHDMMRRTDNEFWFASETGIIVYRNKEKDFTVLKKQQNDPYSLSANEVYSLYQDKKGGVWAGTYFAGLNYYSSQNDKFRKYFPGRTTGSISGNVVREICDDREGNLWVATEDAGLNKIDVRTDQITHYQPTGKKTSISYWNIHGLVADENDLWIGMFEHGVDIMDLKTGLIKKHYPGNTDGLNSNFVFGFLRHTNGGIYLATSNGIYLYSKVKDKFSGIPIAQHLYVYALIEDHHHIIWAATDGGGVFWFNPTDSTHGQIMHKANNNNSLTNDRVNALFEDSFGYLWLATEGGGLSMLDSSRQTFKHFTSADGLPSNYIYKVLEDNQHNVWVSTSKGLASLDPRSSSIKTYTKNNGLLNDQFNYQSGYKSASGKLYFGSIKGLVSFNPVELDNYPNEDVIFITDIQINNSAITNGDDGRPVRFTSGLTVPYNLASFSFDFSALNYANPLATKYRYRLDDLQKEWTVLQSNRRVYFTNIPPGHYNFRVEAAANGVWTASEKRISIIVMPPVWRTKAAYIGYIVITLLLGFLAFWVYRSRINAKKEKELLESKIDFFIKIAHEIKTPLSLITGPLESLTDQVEDLPLIRDDLMIMDRNAKQLTSLVMQALDFRMTEVKGFSLQFINVDITGIVSNVFEGFDSLAKKKRLKYSLNIQKRPIMMQADPQALYKIINNVLGNALKYGKEEVSIRLEENQDNEKEILIIIQNDGYVIPESMKKRIYEPFFRIPATSAESGSGIGLSIASSLAKLHKGKIYSLFTDKNRNTFVILLPIT